ncbi:hypothetical protein B0H17DRAFT_1046455 [Mycena rosella]|uniref:DUF7730 domain-containing protein n=1 Tax=Mycena rosella TaxID=1033263 RepID=A0AAD7DY67_MYCRO|nr:hypothetical protein B0H17DRAFT_1046455 [Mycena rosella]
MPKPRRAREPERKPWPANPPPLASNRIDIGQRSLKQQPRRCLLLALPAELRQSIYEQALGGRVISLTLVASRTASGARHNRVQSACFEPVDEADDRPNKLDVPADSIPVALLLSCRQIYLEALPVLHQQNTFHFRMHELEAVAHAGLGRYCLMDIHSIYLVYSDRRYGWHNWIKMGAVLQQMRTEHLAFEFEFARSLQAGLHRGYVTELEGWWGYAVATIWTLRRFELFFTDGDPPTEPLYRTKVVQRLRELMEADKRYGRVLEKKEQDPSASWRS